jgi:hypothetical protein
MDSRYQGLRDTVTTEAAKAYRILDGEHNVDVVLWETLQVATEKNRTLRRLIVEPGRFIAALYNEYGESEYLTWRNELSQKIGQISVDQQR